MAAPRSAMMARFAAALACWCGCALRVQPGPQEPPAEPSPRSFVQRYEQLRRVEELSVAEQDAIMQDFLGHLPEDLVNPPVHLQEMTNTSGALECLRREAPLLNASYPADAERHVEEIRNALLPWNPRPFVDMCHVEDLWTIGFAHIWFKRSNTSRRLSDYFGPYIPIFTKWVYPWLHGCCDMWDISCGRCPIPHYPPGMIEALRQVVRKDVLYVAVSTNDEGIVGKNEFLMKEFPNILVFSAGGYGHVAVPLQSAHGPNIDIAQEKFDETSVHEKDAYQRVPIPERKYFVSFVGTIGHAPREMREEMKLVVEQWAAEHELADKVLFYHGKGWNEVMYQSRFSLVPRGYGRTSYHLHETLHRGLIPIHIYSDVPWIPYKERVEEVGFITNMTGLPALLSRLLTMSDDEVRQREQGALELAKSHFSAYPVMQQMSRFMMGNATDLVCQGLPRTIRDEDEKYPAPRPKPPSAAADP